MDFMCGDVMMKKIFFSALLVTGAMALYAPTESEKEAIGLFLKNIAARNCHRA